MRQKRFKPKRLFFHRRLKVVGVLVISLALIAGCKASTAPPPEASSTHQEPALKTVKVSRIVKQKIADPTERNAEIESSVQLDVLAKADGEIGQILKSRGEQVQEGEVIVSLTSADAKMQKERADLAVKAAQQAVAKANRDMASSLVKMGIAVTESTKRYNKARNDYDSGVAAQAEVDAAAGQLKNAQLDYQQFKQRSNNSELLDALNNAKLSRDEVYQTLGNLEVKAPVSGLLSELQVSPGLAIAPGAIIGLVQKLDPLKIKVRLNEEEVKLVQSKTDITYYIPGSSQLYKGKIAYLADVIDPQTKTYDLDIEVPNPEMKLKPGMKVRIQLTEEQQGIVVTVPTYSIVTEGDESFVYVLAGDHIEKRKVQLGRLNEPYQEALAGVKEGESVVITDLSRLKDKDKVTASLE